MRSLHFFVAAGVLAFSGSSALSAQAPESGCDREPRTIAPGSSHRCRLAPQDPTAERRTPYQDWILSLREGQTIQIDLESSDFDAYLQVLRRGGSEPVASNDDRDAGSLNSRVFFTAPATDEYIVRASRLFGSDGGGFTLSAAEPVREREPVVIGARAEATIIEEDPVGSGPGGSMRYDAYAFRATAGERVQVDVVSGDFDARLVVLNEAGQTVVSDNDSGTNRNARAMMALPAGRYIVRAGAPPAQSGTYVVTVRRNAAVSPPGPVALPASRGIARTHTGELTLESAADVGIRGRISRLYDLYSLHLARGEAVTIEVQPTSPELRLFLEAGIQSFLGFATVGAGSLSTPTRPSRVELTPARPGGEVLLKVQSLFGGTGQYTLRIVPRLPVTETPPDQSQVE